MKKTQIKDGLRNIFKQNVSFLSIIIIAMLGVTTFLGIDFCTSAMRKNGSDLYNSCNYRDVEIVSTLLFSDEDLESLKGIEGVVDVEPLFYTSAKATNGDDYSNAFVLSLPERVNRLTLKEGKLPVTDTECAIEQKLVDELGLKIGDLLDLQDSEGAAAKYLTGSAFTVTGIVKHPDHTNVIVPDLPYVFVRRAAFDAESLNNCFMRAEIVMKKPENVDRFSDDYKKNVSALIKRIDELAIDCTVRRDDQIHNEATEKLTEGKEKLETAFAQLERAKEQIRNTIRLAYNLAKLPDESGFFEWSTEQNPVVDDPRETARYLWITEDLRIDLTKPLTEFFKAVLSSRIVSDRMLGALYSVTHGGNEVPTKSDGSPDYDAVRTVLAETVDGFGSRYRQLAAACEQWDEGHDEYIAGLDRYNEEIAVLDPCRWLAFDVRGNASFVQMTVSSGNFSKLRATFSLMFVLVGALVIFATVSKMVEEQRTQIGTTKALGFFNREIFVKYLGFGVIATLIGMIIGTVIARFALLPFMLGAFNQYYVYDISAPSMSILSTVIVFVAGIMLAFIAVWFACARLLKEPATKLMQPKAPAARRNKEAKGKRVLPLYSRLIVRNMLADWKRVLVTIVSIAGCCALIVIGISLRSSLVGCVDKQYKEIVDYDVCVKYDPDASGTVREDMEAVLLSEGADCTAVYDANITYRIEDLQLAELICGDIRSIGRFYHLNDWNTGEPLAPTDKGVLLQRRIAETYNLEVGSTFEIAVGGVKTAYIRVAGIFENYIGRTIVMSEEYYQKLFDESVEANALFVRLNGADPEALTERLQAVEGYESVTRADADRSIIETSTSLINIVVIMFVFIAAVMAGVVQLNLTNMYVQQKKRELTIMRVNGFTVKEIVGYVLRETVITTILGIIIGIASGAGIAYSIIRTLEQSFLQFDRSVSLIAWLVGAALTVLFTVIVNAIALRKVKNLKLTDVA